MDELKNDKNLRQAVSRREQKMPPMPADLNERLMQRLEKAETAPVARQKRLWLYAAVAVAASIALLIVFHFGKEQTPQEPVVAQQTIQQPTPQQIEGEPVEKPGSVTEEPQQKVAKAEVNFTTSRGVSPSPAGPPMVPRIPEMDLMRLIFLFAI